MQVSPLLKLTLEVKLESLASQHIDIKKEDLNGYPVYEKVGSMIFDNGIIKKALTLFSSVFSNFSKMKL